MKTSTLSSCIAIASVLGFATPSLKAGLLLSESFADGQRLVQNLPATSAWYSSTSGASLTYENGALTSPKGHHLVTYFTDMNGAENQVIALGVGDKLVVEFSFSITGSASNSGGLRVGLMDSGGSRISKDSQTLNAAAFLDYTGYAAFLSNGAGSAGKFYKRNPGVSNALIHSGSTVYSDLMGAGSGTGATFVDGTNYTGTFTLERTASGVFMSISLSGLDGYSFSYTDSDAPCTSFDTFVIWGAANLLETYTLTGFTVNYIAAVPEPNSAGAIMGVVMMGAVVSRRRFGARVRGNYR